MTAFASFFASLKAHLSLGRKRLFIKIHIPKFLTLGIIILVVSSFHPTTLPYGNVSDFRYQSYFYFLLGSLAGLESNSKVALEYYQYAAQFDQGSSILLMKQAEEFINMGQTEQAIPLLEKVSKEEDNNPDYHLLKARIASIQADLDATTASLDRASALYTEAGNKTKARETALTKVAMLADYKKYPESISELELYLRSAPDDEVAYYFLGKIHSLFQNRKPAQRAFRKALDLRPGFTAASKALGLQLELEGNITEAISVYHSALAVSGGDTELLQKLVNLSLIEENYETALGYLKQSLAIDPKDSQSQMRAALIHYKLKQFPDAKEIFEEMLKDPSASHDRVYFYLASLCVETDDPKRAVDLFSRIDSKSDYYAEGRIQMSLLQSVHFNENDKAIRSLQEAVEKREDNPELFLALAAEHERQNHLPESIRILTKATELFKDNEKILFMLGTLLDRAGDTKGGIEKMRLLLAINPNHAHALNHIGYSYVEQKVNLPEAEIMLKKAVQLAPDNGFILDSLGWLYYQTGEYKKASKILERANAMAPSQPVILEHLADTYSKMGLQQQALEVYKRIMRWSGDAAHAKQTDDLDSNSENKVVQERVRNKMALLDTDNTY